MLQQFHAHPLAPAMLAGIRQPLLNDAVDGIFQDRNQPLKANLALKVDLDSVLTPLFVHEVGHRRYDPGFVEDGRFTPLIRRRASQWPWRRVVISDSRAFSASAGLVFFWWKYASNCMIAPANC